MCHRTVYRKRRCRRCYRNHRKTLFHCTYKHCVKPVFAATLCQYHYKYWKRRCTLCDNHVYCRSLCRKHYRIAIREDIFPPEPKCLKCNCPVYVQDTCINHFKEKYKQSTCVMVGCEATTHKKGMCCKHYFRERRINNKQE